MYHENGEVSQAQVKLCDALCEMERGTGRRTLLVLVDAQGYDFVVVDGKPLPVGSPIRGEIVAPVRVVADRCLNTTDSERRFPLQGLGSVPWDVAEVAYSTYRRCFHNDQTMERLAERGGFGVEEFCLLYMGLNPAGRDQRTMINAVAIVSAFLGSRLDAKYGTSMLERLRKP